MPASDRPTAGRNRRRRASAPRARRARDGGRPAEPESTPSRGQERLTALAPHTEDDTLLGPYETTYRVARGYGTERVIIRP